MTSRCPNASGVVIILEERRDKQLLESTLSDSRMMADNQSFCSYPVIPCKGS